MLNSWLIGDGASPRSEMESAVLKTGDVFEGHENVFSGDLPEMM